MILDNDSTTDPNKLLPVKYPFARQCYKAETANHWTPDTIAMGDDVTQWKTGVLTPEERQMVLMNLGFFSTAESLTANNLVLALYRYINDPGCRQYMLLQAATETIHSETFVYCCDTLGLDPDEIYTAYENIKCIKEKDDFVVGLTKTLLDPTYKIDTNSAESIQRLLYDLIGFYVIMEGIFFYAGFCMILGLKRRNIMKGVGEQFDYIKTDEGLHMLFGNGLIDAIITEYPHSWTKEFQDKTSDLIKTAVTLEQVYAREACPPGIEGMTADQICDYVEYIADRRLARLGLPTVYGKSNPFPWMEASVDLPKRKNFFESRVTDYQTGSLEW